MAESTPPLKIVVSYVVTAPLVVAHTPHGDVYLYQWATLPEFLAPDEVQRLVDGDFVVKVEGDRVPHTPVTGGSDA